MKKLVLTGAAGRLGSYLREPLSKLATELVSSDILPDIGKLYPGERYQKADLSCYSEIHALLEGADMVVHFGAIVDEAPFETLLGPNFIGAYNIWEAAARHNLSRVIYASSLHAVGMYRKDENIGLDVPQRPDSFYGLAKCFAENLGRMYWDKSGLEAVCLRIMACAPVENTRSLALWLSYNDLIELVTRAIDSPSTGFSVIYGVSNNDRAPVDNTGAAHLGYRPKDNAEKFAAEILSKAPPANPHDRAETCLGGPFASIALGQNVMASMNITDDQKKP